MALSQKRSKRKVSGGKYQKARHKKKKELGKISVKTILGKPKRKVTRTLGGSKKMKTYSSDEVSIIVSGKKQKAKIKRVIFNPANKHYVRLGIVTRKAVVDTDAGYVRITSRPGQTGSLCGVVLSKAESANIESMIKVKK